MLSMADLLRRARRHEEIPVAENQPATPARRLMTLASTGAADPKRVAALFSRDLRPDLLEGRTLRLPGGRQLLAQDLPRDVALDFALGALRESVTGDDSLGYRVGFSFPLEKNAQDLAVYVVHDAGEYRIAGLGTVRSTLGDEALRRLDRGDLAGARRWLDWALDEAARANVSGGVSGGPGAPGAEAGDPLPTDPFPALWRKGMEGTAEQARCAAAALIAPVGDAAKAVLALLSCRAADADPARRNALDLALVLAYARLDRLPELEEASRRLLAAVPSSEFAERLHAQDLVSLGDHVNQFEVEIWKGVHPGTPLIAESIPARSKIGVVALGRCLSRRQQGHPGDRRDC